MSSTMAGEKPHSGRLTHSSSSSDTSAHSHTQDIIQGRSSTDNNALKKLDSKVIDVKGSDDDPYKHLSTDEAAIIKRQLDIPEVSLTYLSLFRYATFNDKFFIVTAGLAAITAGAVLPLMTIVFGELAGVFQRFMMNTIDPTEFQHTLNKYVLYVLPDRYILFGVGILANCFVI